VHVYIRLTKTTERKKMSRDENKPNHDYRTSPLYFKLLGEQLSKMSSPLTENIVKDLEAWVLEYAFTDGNLISDLKRAIIEIKYQNHIISELRAQVENLEADGQMMSDRLRRENI
jgi:hypothetical protein